MENFTTRFLAVVFVILLVGSGLVGNAARHMAVKLLVVLSIISFFVLGAATGALASRPYAYIPNSGDNNVSVIDASTNSVVTTVGVGSSPQGVAVNPTGTRVYVTNHNSNNVSVIDTSTDIVVATIGVGTNPVGVAVNPTGTRAYVANFGSGNISVIDTSTNSVITTISVGDCFGVAFNPAGTLAYVTTRGSNSVVIINTSTNSIVGTVGNIPPTPPASRLTRPAQGLM